MATTKGLKESIKHNSNLQIVIIFSILLLCCCFIVGLTGSDTKSKDDSKKTEEKQDSNADNKDNAKTDDQKTDEKKEEPAPTPAPAPEPVKTTQDILKDTMKDTIGTSHKTLVYDEKTKIVTITEEGETYWDETNTVQKCYRQLIHFGIKAFKVDGVNEAKFIIKTEFTDSYGKSSKEVAVRFGFKKAEFQKYDWNNLIGENIYVQLSLSTSDYYIHPAIEKNLKYDKLSYV